MSEALRQRLGASARALCQGLALPYRTYLRWRARHRRGEPILQTPGPKKVDPLPLAELQVRVEQLVHRTRRSFGAPALARELSGRVSTRQVADCVRAQRRHLHRQQRQSFQRIQWLVPNLVWSIDGSETKPDLAGTKLRFAATQDLASRYRFEPLFALELKGAQIAEHLEKLFHRQGAPLFLKRDNGSNLNSAEVNDVLARHLVIPLNSPAHYPRYNGAMENSIGHFKKHLLPCLHTPKHWDLQAIAPIGRALVLQLNAQPRRSLQSFTHAPPGPSQLPARLCNIAYNPNLIVNLNAVCPPTALFPTPAAIYQSLAQPWSKRFRQNTFHWIENQWIATVSQMEKTNRRSLATAWRASVVAWLVRQALIRVSSTTTVLPLSPLFI